MKRELIGLCLAALWVSACGAGTRPDGSDLQEAWKPHDAPIQLDGSFIRRFDLLPTQGFLEKTPWADSYWPSYEGGISARWLADDPLPFKYETLSLEALQSASADEIRALSPAEKFDILNGDYTYPLVLSEWRRTSPYNETWEGLCHGWAPAAALFEEPHPVELTNADGITIPFGSSDVKALLTYYQGQVSRAPIQFLGMRCNVKLDDLLSGRANMDDCKGVNPGAFHIVLTNQIALKQESFMADVTRDFEVWNHPVSGYRSVITPKAGVGPTAAPGTVKEVFVTTSMDYSVELLPGWLPNKGRESTFTRTRVYEYTLEIDANGEIIGGEWLGADRPDFLWNQQTVPFFGEFQKLEDLYKASIR